MLTQDEEKEIKALLASCAGGGLAFRTRAALSASMDAYRRAVEDGRRLDCLLAMVRAGLGALRNQLFEEQRPEQGATRTEGARIEEQPPR